MGEKVEAAFELFSRGLNCAQAVVGAFCSQGEYEAKLALKLAAGFGGGMRCGEVCGAVTGALMVIGLREGQYLVDDPITKAKCSKLISHFMEEYAKRKGTLLCRELLGYDVRDQEASRRYADQKRAICEDAIKTAILLLEEMSLA